MVQRAQSGDPALVSSAEAVLLPHHQPGLVSPRGLLLCCVCHEQSTTTYRYEVVYKAPDKFAATSVTQSDDNDNDYYNFPLRHPRHGHLRWPVLTRTLTRTLLLHYPDYPVHLSTVTLKRLKSRSKLNSTDGKRQKTRTGSFACVVSNARSKVWSTLKTLGGTPRR